MRKLGLFLIFISFSSPGQILLDATGSANNFSVNYPANLNGTIPPGFTITFRSNQNVTGQAFLSVNGSTPIEIMRNFNSGLTANSIRMGQFVTVVYDNFNGIWQLMSPEASVSIPSQWIENGSNIYFPNNVGIGTTAPGKNTGAQRYLTVSAVENAPGPPPGIASIEMQGYANTANSPVSRIDFNNVIASSAPSNHARITALSGASFEHGQLVFSTSYGTLNERMRITEVGRVGIGENNPLIANLEVINSSFNSVAVFGNGVRGVTIMANDAGIGFNQYKGSGSNIYSMSGARTAEIVYDNSLDAFRFSVSNGVPGSAGTVVTNVQRMILSNNGRLGLGASFGAGPSFDISFSSNSDKTIGIEQGGSLGRTLTITGGSAIGTDQSGGELVLSTGASTGNAGSIMRFKGSNGGQGTGSTQRLLVDRMVIDASGNVGIGTSSPSSILQITSTQGPILRINRNSGALNNGDPIGAIELFDNQNGTSSQATIVVRRDAASSGSTDLPTSFEFLLTKDGSNTLFPAMKIDNSGDVGIGVNNPQAQLHSSLTTTSANYAAIRGETFGTGGIQALGGYSWARGSGGGAKALGFAAIADPNTPTNSVGLYVGYNSTPGTVPTLTVTSALWVVGNGSSARAAVFENGGVGINTNFVPTNTALSIKDGHFQSQQTSPPTFSGGTVTLSNATDVAGNLSIGITATIGLQTTINFNRSYATAPIVILFPTGNQTSAGLFYSRQIYVIPSTSGFGIYTATGATTGTMSVGYIVIETQ